MVWLSVWSEVQIVCIWSSRCHCHHKIPPSHASFKSKLVFTFLVRLAQVVLEKMPLNGCSSSSSSNSSDVRHGQMVAANSRPRPRPQHRGQKFDLRGIFERP